MMNGIPPLKTMINGISPWTEKTEKLTANLEIKGEEEYSSQVRD
jgi:hypothetical protein